MLGRIAIGIINILPRRAALAIGGIAGRLLYGIYVLTRHRGSMERTIRTAFPDRFSGREVRRLARKHASDFMKTVVEVARCRELPTLLQNGAVRVEGLEHLDEALKRGRGAVLLSAHFGNWELLIALFGLLGYPTTAVVARQVGERFNAWLVGERGRFGTKILYAFETSSREIEERLRNNEVVILLADHHHHGGKSRNIVEFFGHPVSVPAGPVVYTARTGAALVPAYALRLRDGSHRICVEPPLELQSTGDFNRDILENCRRYMSVYERWIRSHPDQWMWSHARWDWLAKESGKTPEESG